MQDDYDNVKATFSQLCYPQRWTIIWPHIHKWLGIGSESWILMHW